MKRITFINSERTNRVLDFSEKLTNAATVDLAWSLYSNALAQLGAKSAVYGFFPKTVGRSIASEVVAMSSHPEEFNTLYLDQGYIDHDPFAQYALTEDQRPISWQDPRAGKYRTEKSEFFQNSLRDFGMDYGVTIPVRDASNWKLGGTGVCFEASNDKEGDEIVALSLDCYLLLPPRPAIKSEASCVFAVGVWTQIRPSSNCSTHPEQKPWMMTGSRRPSQHWKLQRRS